MQNVALITIQTEKLTWKISGVKVIGKSLARQRHMAQKRPSRATSHVRFSAGHIVTCISYTNINTMG